MISDSQDIINRGFSYRIDMKMLEKFIGPSFGEGGAVVSMAMLIEDLTVS